MEPGAASSLGGEGSATEPHPISASATDANTVLPAGPALTTVLLLTQLLHYKFIGRTFCRTTRDPDVSMFILGMRFSEKWETS